MLTPEEAARARAELDLTDFFEADVPDGDPDYWEDLDLTEKQILALNNFASESPEQAMSNYFPYWPRWMRAAKCYAETVIRGLADTYLRADAASAIDAVSMFRTRCDELTRYLWDEHFKSRALSWNQLYRHKWQLKLPDFPVPEIVFEHFEFGMNIWKEDDPYRPEELSGDCIQRFWEHRATIVPEDKALLATHAGFENVITLPGGNRLSSRITSPIAARKMEAYLVKKGIAPSVFAGLAGTTDRTLRAFRSSGKVRRDILEGIAKAMGTTMDDLMS